MKKSFTLALVLCLAVCMLAACGGGGGSSSADTGKTIPKSDYNPLTGYEKGAGFPEGVRPVAIMVDNIYNALPQSGTAGADVIYEMVTEGGVTRLMCLYSDYKAIAGVGPVRSIRDQFIQLAMPANAVPVHIGTSKYAADMLNYYTYRNLDGIYLGEVAFKFDRERAKTSNIEHCWYTTGALITAGMTEVGLDSAGGTLPLFSFLSPDVPRRIPAQGEAGTVTFSLSSTTETSFAYDAAAGLYMKSEYGIPQMDAVTNTQLGFDNLFILGTDIGLKDNGFCADFNFSSGVGYYMSAGGYEKVDWSKGKAGDALVIKAGGSEIKVNCGKSYVAFISNTRLSQITIEGLPQPAPAGDSTSGDTASDASSPS